MSYSRRQLEAFGEPLGESSTRVKPGGQGRIYGGGGGGPTSSTVTQTNLPEYAKPYVEALLGAGLQQGFTTQTTGTGADQKIDITGMQPFRPYSLDPREYVAGFSPLQQASFLGAQQLQVPGQIGLGSDITAAAAASSADVGRRGLGYGQTAAGMGDWYGSMVKSPEAMQAYMSPYQQNVTDLQIQAAQRQADIARTQRGYQAARAGAFGGSRQAIENAEAERALASQKANIQAQGTLAAYNQALGNIGQQAQFGLQGIGTGLQGAQLGLGALGQSGQLGGQLGQLGQQQQAAATGILGLQSQLGGQQQQQQQQIINQAIQNYATAQQYPQQQLSFLNALIRGMATPTTTVESYQAAPSIGSQIAGLAGTGISAYGLSQIGKKKGGAIKDTGQGIDELMHRRIMDKKVAA